MAKLKTGDVRRFKREEFSVFDEAHAWALIYTIELDRGFPHWTVGTRSEARGFKLACDRIAKILKITPKTITVEISK